MVKRGNRILSTEEFRKLFDRRERAVLDRLTTPRLVQDFLDRTEYSSEPVYRSPRSVMRDLKAHCVDGALFAAAALRYHGRPPVVMELSAVRDDDHFLTLFEESGFLGCVAKSNFVGLRYREPIHRSRRELALSYFELYYNLAGEKTLRGYSRAVDLGAFDWTSWAVEDDLIEAQVVEAVAGARHFRLLTPAQEAGLSPMDRRAYEAGLMGANADGLYKVS